MPDIEERVLQHHRCTASRVLAEPLPVPGSSLLVV